MNSEEREREKLRIQELKKKWRVSPRKKQKRFQKDSYVVRTNPSMYNMYRMKKKKEGKLDEVPPRNLFAQVVFKFLYMILEKVITQGYIFHMPYKLGSIRLNKVKYKCRSKFAFSSDRLAVKAWDYSYSIFWDKDFAKFKNMDVRLFYPSARFKNLKEARILQANEDPLMKDLIGYAPNEELRRRVRKIGSEYKKPSKKLPTLDEYIEKRNKNLEDPNYKEPDIEDDDEDDDLE